MISWTQVETILKEKKLNNSEISLIKDAFDEIGGGAASVSVDQVYQALGKIENSLKTVPPK